MKNKRYHRGCSIMINHLKEKDVTLDYNEYLDEETQKIFYHSLKKIFVEKRNYYILDTVMYNFIRNKPLFTGIDTVRENTVYDINQRFFYGTKYSCFPSSQIGNDLIKYDNEEIIIIYNKILMDIKILFNNSFKKENAELNYFK